MKYLAFTLMVAAALSNASAARVWKCDVDGKTEYQQTPCAQAAKAEHVYIMPGQASESALAAREIRLQQLAEVGRTELAMREGRLVVGMTPQQAYSLWGTPKAVHSIALPNGTVVQQWFYRPGTNVYIRDGRVALIEEAFRP